MHISAVARAGMRVLGQKIAFDVVTDRRTGKSSAQSARCLIGSAKNQNPTADVLAGG